jgi:hypothetical protein
MLRHALIWTAVVLLGCSSGKKDGAGNAKRESPKGEVTTSATTDAGSATPTTKTPPATKPPAKTGPCADIAARFKATLARGSGTCKTAADCGCYNPVAAGLACGGVTDKTTSTQLAKIQQEFFAAKCKWPIQCAAWECKPRCVSGACQR